MIPISTPDTHATGDLGRRMFSLKKLKRSSWCFWNLCSWIMKIAGMHDDSLISENKCRYIKVASWNVVSGQVQKAKPSQSYLSCGNVVLVIESTILQYFQLYFISYMHIPWHNLQNKQLHFSMNTTIPTEITVFRKYLSNMMFTYF